MKGPWIALTFLLAACSQEPTAAPPPLSLPLSPDQVRSETTVSNSSGPIQLTLRLHRTRVRVGGPIYYQLELKNVGDRPIPVVDKIFRDPAAETWPVETVHLELMGADGKLAAANWKLMRPHGEAPGSAQRYSPAPSWLQPGDSTSTVTWVWPERGGRRAAMPGFTDLWTYDLNVPGKYKLRAVYDHSLSTVREFGTAVRVETPFVAIDVAP